MTVDEIVDENILRCESLGLLERSVDADGVTQWRITDLGVALIDAGFHNVVLEAAAEDQEQ